MDWWPGNRHQCEPDKSVAEDGWEKKLDGQNQNTLSMPKMVFILYLCHIPYKNSDM